MKFIDTILMWLHVREAEILGPQVDRMTNEVRQLDQTAAQRLAAFDAEAKLHRDHFKARLEIDAIELKRNLAAKQHRLAVLCRELSKEAANVDG